MSKEKFEGKPGNDFPANTDNNSVEQNENISNYSTKRNKRTRKYHIDITATRYMDYNEEVFYEALLSSAQSLEEIQAEMESITMAIMELNQTLKEKKQ